MCNAAPIQIACIEQFNSITVGNIAAKYKAQASFIPLFWAYTMLLAVGSS